MRMHFSTKSWSCDAMVKKIKYWREYRRRVIIGDNWLFSKILHFPSLFKSLIILFIIIRPYIAFNFHSNNWLFLYIATMKWLLQHEPHHNCVLLAFKSEISLFCYEWRMTELFKYLKQIQLSIIQFSIHIKLTFLQ